MNQVKARSWKEVMSCMVLTSRSVMFFAFHTTSHKNQNCSRSSDPVPLKMGSLISSARWAMAVLGGLGGGQDVDGGGLYRGRFTCGQNTLTWLTVGLRRNFRGNRASLRGDWRVSNRRVFFRV